MKRLAIITTLHRRPELTRVFFRYYEGWMGLYGAYSDDEDTQFLHEEQPRGYKRPHHHLVRFPNQPRSDKWNAAAELMRGRDIDGAFIVGSDDFLSEAYIDYVSSLGADYACPTGCYFYEARTRRLAYGRFDRMGAGRYLSRRALGACDYRPWIEGSQRNADWALGQKLGKMFEPVMIDNADLPILDVKTHTPDGEPESITTYDKARQMAKAWTPVARDEMKGVFPGLFEKLDALYSDEMLHMAAGIPRRCYD